MSVLQMNQNEPEVVLIKNISGPSSTIRAMFHKKYIDGMTDLYPEVTSLIMSM